MLPTGFVRLRLTTPAAMHIRPLRGRNKVRGRIMAHRVVVGKKPANKIGRLNIGEIAALRSQ